MKKTFTKLAGGIMAASMILGTVGVAAPQVFADDTATTPDYSITVNNAVEGDKGTHTYTAYQIFKAQEVVTGQDGKATKELKEITWGSAISASADGTTANFDDDTKAALVALFNGVTVPNVTEGVTLDNCTKATVIAQALSTLDDDSTNLKRFSVIMEGIVDTTTGVAAGTDNKAEVSDPGYYLVVDTNTTTGDKKDTYTSEFMLKVAGPTQIDTKGDLPKSNKTVQDDEADENFGADSIDNKEKDTADYDIGDDVPFTLYGTVAENYQEYNVNYKYAFVDQFCAGLDDPTDIVVTATVKNGTTPVTLKNVTAETDKSTGYQIVSPTAIQNPTDAYTKEWKITFDNLKTVKDVDGNDVKDILEIRVTYNSKLNKNAQIGTTNGNPNKSHIEYSNNPNKNEEGKSEDTHVKVFTYEYDVTKVDANQKPLDGAGFTLYKVGKDGAETPVYVNAEGKVLNAEEIAALGANASAEVKPESGNLFNYIGLDEGNYKLVETTVPAGYNKAKDITFTISATQTGTNDDTAGSDVCVVENVKRGNDADSDAVGGSNGIFNSTVINNSGAELPSTGGIGTTIFYIVGAAAAVTAIVLLTTRRRAHKND